MSSIKVESEVDTILKKRDVVKAATEDWKSKWAPAVLAYVKSLKSKAIKNALMILQSKFHGKPKHIPCEINTHTHTSFGQCAHLIVDLCFACVVDDEEDEKSALYLMITLLLKGDPDENLNWIFEEHQVWNAQYSVKCVIILVFH